MITGARSPVDELSGVAVVRYVRRPLRLKLRMSGLAHGDRASGSSVTG